MWYDEPTRNEPVGGIYVQYQMLHYHAKQNGNLVKQSWVATSEWDTHWSLIFCESSRELSTPIYTVTIQSV
jgi:hypothetical protein